jgi:cysteine desulfurase
MTRVYLDYNATTPVLPEVAEAMLPFWTKDFGNPSSAHPEGQRARKAVEIARGQLAALFSVEPDEVVFTSCGTEATHLALFGLAGMQPGRRHIVTSCVEHPATLGPCSQLEANGFRVTRLPVQPDGRVSEAAAADAIDDATLVVSIMHANNETGAIMPVAPIFERARARGALIHCDAAQSTGKVRVDALDADLISIAGHKLYAPKGVGALIVKRGVRLQPMFVGGGQERGLRPGTENVASIVGLGVAAELARRDLAARRAHLARLADGMLWRLRAKIPGLMLNGPEQDRLPNTLNVSFPKVRGSALLARTQSVSASTGSACHADVESPSAVLSAMGLPAERALGAIRISVGTPSSEADVERACDDLCATYFELTSA